VQPQVAARHHLAGAAGALVDDHVLHGVAAAHAQGLVHDGLQGDVLAAAALFVGGDDHARLGVLDTVAHRLGEKPPNTTEWIAPMRGRPACDEALDGQGR